MADFKPALLVLLREVFFGVPEGLNYTWFVQGREAIFPSLAALSAKDAGRVPGPGIASIAAHANHALFALRGVNGNFGFPEPEGDWESSWVEPRFDEAVWTELQREIQVEYAKLVKGIEDLPAEVEQDLMNSTLATLPHMAFHLGAIRQLMKSV